MTAPILPFRRCTAKLTPKYERLKKTVFGGVIWVHDLSADRDNGAQARRSLAKLAGVCPEVTAETVALLTTKWSLPESSQVFPARETQLKASNWANLVGSGAHVKRLYPDSEKEGPSSAWQVIRHTLWRLDVRLGRQSLEEVLRLRADLEKNGKAIPEEANALVDALRGGLTLQKEVSALLENAVDQGEAAEENIRGRAQKLQRLHETAILNKSLFYAALVPALRRKRIAFNALVVQ